MRGLVEEGRQRLGAGASAFDIVFDTVAELEASGLYIAGRGSSPNLAGEFELDACIMDGTTAQAGAVAALQGFESPIAVARALIGKSPHVMLAGEGAGLFARLVAAAPIGDQATWFRPACTYERHVQTGTVGCVARDTQGNLAAATSTGGVFGKMPGRCGDTPVIGAGCWADRHVAVCCTGHGEFFIRRAAAAQVSHRMRWADQSVDEACEATLAEIAELGGSGGIIAIDAMGNVAMPFRSTGLKRASLLPDGSIYAAAF